MNRLTVTLTPARSLQCVLGGGGAELIFDPPLAQLELQLLPVLQGAPGATGPVVRTASETMGGHRIVRSTGAGTVGYADATNAAHGDDTQGMTVGAVVSGSDVGVQSAGSITNAGWAWTPGAPVFLGLSSLPTQTEPTKAAGFAFLQVIGHAQAATVLFLRIEPPLYFED